MSEQPKSQPQIGVDGYQYSEMGPSQEFSLPSSAEQSKALRANPMSSLVDHELPNGHHGRARIPSENQFRATLNNGQPSVFANNLINENSSVQQPMEAINGTQTRFQSQQRVFDTLNDREIPNGLQVPNSGERRSSQPNQVQESSGGRVLSHCSFYPGQQQYATNELRNVDSEEQIANEDAQATHVASPTRRNAQPNRFNVNGNRNGTIHVGQLNGHANGHANGHDVRILSDSDMPSAPSAYQTDNDPARQVERDQSQDLSIIREDEGPADLRLRPAQTEHLRPSTTKGVREPVYTTDYIPDQPDTARSIEFMQTTDRPMVNNFPQDELNNTQVHSAHLPTQLSTQPDLTKDKIDQQINKWERQQADKEEVQSDVFKQYCEAETYDERVAIQQDYIQKHTPYGERVKMSDVLMMKQLPKLKQHLYPPNKLNDNDMIHRFDFCNIKKDMANEVTNWRRNDDKGNKKKPYVSSIILKNNRILVQVDKDSLERCQAYEDTWPLLQARKGVWKFCIYVNLIAHKIITTKVFENISIFVILMNSLVMMMEDPADQNPPEYFALIDNIFLALYSIEMVLKILGLGLIFGEHAYLKNSWNMLDFVIVLSGYITLVTEMQKAQEAAKQIQVGVQQQESGVDLAGLRVFRVIRPLKTISSVKGLKVLMEALMKSIPLLKDTIIILLFFFAVYSIAGTQLMSGNLKNRCVSIQEGRPHEDELICGGFHSCPGGYFCGKTNDNPNFGVSNFDNAMYSLLIVFQSVTLEGWSEIQRMMQQAYTIYIFIYFLPLVFIGAFFLLNLTLAVINSSFTEAHNEQQQREAKAKASNMAFDADEKGNDENAQVKQMKEDLSLGQHIAAQRAAKKMIQFLRTRQQEAKEAELARQKELEEIMPPQFSLGSIFGFGKKNQVNPKEKKLPKTEKEKIREAQKIKQQAERQKQNKTPPVPQKIGKQISNDAPVKGQTKPEKAKSETLPEPNADEKDKQAISDDKSGKNQGNVIEIQKGKKKGQNINDEQQEDKVYSKFDDVKIEPSQNGIPLKMKGNQLGIKRQFLPPIKNFKEDGKLGKSGITREKIVELDFDFLINKDKEEESPDLPARKRHTTKNNPVGLNTLHFDDSDIIEQSEGAEEKEKDGSKRNRKQSKKKKKEQEQESQLPKTKMKGTGPVIDMELDLDTSDSEVNEAIEKMRQIQKENLMTGKGGDTGMLTDEQIIEIKQSRKKKEVQTRLNLFFKNSDTLIYNENNVSKTFKKLLNTSRMISNRRQEKGIPPSGKKVRRKKKDQEEVVNINEDIEKKYQRKIGTLPITQKSDQQFAEIFGDRKDNWKGGMKKGDPETMSITAPAWPFEDIEKQRFTKKVQIKENKLYFGTSMADIMEARYAKTHNAAAKAATHNYVCLQKEEQWYDREQMQMSRYMRSIYHPFQQKIFYEVRPDSSDPDTEPDIENILHNLDQPFDTVAQVNYKEQLKGAPLKLLTRRSDFLAMSTIQMSLNPIDKRDIAKVQLGAMKKDYIKDYVNERNLFKRMCNDLDSKSKYIKEKDKDFRDNYFRSFLHRTEFKTNSMTRFNDKVQELNHNGRTIDKVDPEKRRAELIKWQQNKRAVENKQMQKFTMHNVFDLLEGNFHEMDELEALDKIKIDSKKENSVKKLNDEIPKSLRQEFDIPEAEKMDGFQPDFGNIKKHDMQIKKRRPMWSGQDVMPDKLDYMTSMKVVADLNKIRVWPIDNVYNIWKRFRAVLRIIIRTWFFDNFLTFAVLLNTITLSLNHYGIKPEMEALLDVFNDYFTQIFIAEMGFKVFAMGVYKYCSDVMNILDGSVVIISIFEIIYTKAAAGNMDLKAFSTIRMFRTFRVFRIARLLRGLESMQTIIDVIARSYESFIYITLLMTIFVFIFSLLGMQLFGGKFNYPDGLPRGNYDSFSIAAITVFQILTMENWIAVLFDSLRGDLNKFLVSVFYMSWIFLGNFILLNLFLAILLDSFLEEEEEEEIDQQEYEEALRLKQLKKRKKIQRLQKDMVIFGKNKIDFIKEEEDNNSSAEDLEDMDEEQITTIFKDEGLMKKEAKDLEKEKLNMYQGVDCQMSFYLFDKEFDFRKLCYKCIKSKLWDNIVMLLIFLSSIKLCFDSYYLNADPELPVMKASENVDMIFNICFIIEMVIKQIAIGFVMDEGSYLQSSWNQLDFFIVMSSIMDMALSQFKIAMIKILRLLRTLRPLRVISHNKDLKMIVIALMESVGGIFNVMVVVFMVWLIFAIMGVNFYGGKFQFCSVDMYGIRNQLDCEFVGGEWQTYDQNFDDALKAMNVLYIVSSLEGWPDIMLQAVDSTDIERGPEIEASVIHAIFFVIFILIGSFFFLNFFIGVLFLKYNQAQKSELKGFTKEDMCWIDIQKLILTTEPEYESTNVPLNPNRKKFHILVTSPEFDIVIMGCIILNMIQMALSYETITETLIEVLRISNYIFSAIFFIEAVLKLIAFGKSYFRNAWNKFDFFVVVSSIFDLVLEVMGSSLSWLAAGPQIARVMRVLRVTRVLRLFGKAKGLQAIIQTIIFSIPSILNVTMLLMLIFFMFSILGVFMFGEVTEGEVLDDLKNFNNFFNAFLLLFALSTGEDWNLVMFDCGRTPPDCIPGRTCGNMLSKLYFYGLVLVCSHVMLNLFILVIIQQFELYYLPKENMIVKFKQDLKCFMDVWIKFTQKKYKCQRIKEKMLLDFFQELGEKHEGEQDQSLGFRKDLYNEAEVKKNMLKMGIRNENGFIYFNELLYRAMRRKYGNFKVKKNMQVNELRTQFAIYLKTQQEIHGGIRQINNEDIFNTIIKKESGVNPFLTMMNFKISFRTWLRHANIKIKKEAYTLLRQEDKYEEEEPIIFEVDIDNEVLMSATSEEEEEMEKQQSIIERSKQKTIVNKDKKPSSNALQQLEKGLNKKLRKQKKLLNQGEDAISKTQSVKENIDKALEGKEMKKRSKTEKSTPKGKQSDRENGGSRKY